MKLYTDFETFYARIVLGEKQEERIRSAASALMDHLIQTLALAPDDVYLQGSWANGTAIKPDPDRKDGEYDVDMVVVCADSDDSPEQALADLRDAIAAHATYAKMIEDDDGTRPCVRLRYADDEVGGFHVDVVPARRATTGSAPLEVPRPGVGWCPTDPDGYRQWCEDQGDEFARAVQMLKRWRDHNQGARQAIKSIVLQVLISHHMPDVANDADRVAGTLRGIADFLGNHPDAPPVVCNPVLPDENLTERWPVGDYKNFRQVVADAASLAEEAIAAPDVNPSREKWQELFGSDFPGPDDSGRHSAPVPPPGAGRSRPQKAPRVEWGW